MSRPASIPASGAPGPGIVSLMANHAVAANLLMAMMILLGVWAVRHLNIQFFPTFSIDVATVRVVWSGASAQDVEELITTPLELQLRNVDFVKEMTSTSREGISVIHLEFEEGTDMGPAMDRVKQSVDQVQTLPRDAEEPLINQAVRYEDIGKVLVTGGPDLDQLRPVVNRMEQELLDRGIAKVFVRGLPEEQIAIEVSSERLRELGLSMDDLARRISAWSQNLPIGLIGNAETTYQLRFQERRESGIAFETIPIIASGNGRLVLLGDLAEIRRKPLQNQELITVRGNPAVELSLNRTESGDTLESARILHQWLEETGPLLPPGVEVTLFGQQWELIQDRINILLKNGLSGLALVLFILFFFLRGPVAFWTATGIFVSFMAALGVLYIIGGSINMISLFGMIMALGIIVDDAIVVGENAMNQFTHHGNQGNASVLAAKRMLAPVFASSLTTIAAFFPLMLVGGIMGAIMQAIPTVVICIIVASLIECFLVLPGHLTHSFRRLGTAKPNRLRQSIDGGFNHFRDRIFRPLVSLAVSAPMSTLAIAVATLIFTAGWVASGRVAFEFFPTEEADTIFVDVSFVSGTPSHIVEDYLLEAEETLYRIEEEFGQPFIQLLTVHTGVLSGREAMAPSSTQSDRSEHLGSIGLELVDPNKRSIRNREIIEALQARMPPVPGREAFNIKEPRPGPPGNDIDIRITGSELQQVKKAAVALTDILEQIPGVYGVEDNMPYGREQLVLELTPTAKSLGFSVESLATQIRAAYDGITVQELSDGFDEVEVRLSLPQDERDTVVSLEKLDIVLPDGGTERIGNLVTVGLERGFETIRHSGVQLAVTVSGSVDPAVTNSNRIHAELKSSILPSLVSEHGVRFSFEGRQSDQEETLADMRFSLIPALGLIYLVLAWVFSSYSWPLVVMSIIPFGLIGAIWGHVILGLDLTVLSLMGIFCLSGIVVNNAIILVVFYRTLKSQGMNPEEAIVAAACQRLRAVILTSMTTIAGLTPLLFETSLSARFLIPMAAGIAFGLLFATLLVLFLVPALLLATEKLAMRYTGSQSQPA